MINQNARKLRVINAPGSKLVAQQQGRRKCHFTKKVLDSLQLPEGGQRSYVYDDTVRGLALATSPSGKKTFLLYRKLNGRPERINIGPYPDITIEQARGRAEELNAAIARGDNPGDQQRAVRDEWMLGDLFAQYLEHYAKLHKKTWRDDVGLFNLHFHGWKLRKISSIRKIDVVMLHAKIGRNRGPYAANRAIELLSTIFNRARDWGWKGDNPAARIDAFRERKRDRFLGPEELPAFFKALDEELNETIRDYIAISLMTGARRSNVQEMKWEQVDGRRATWRIPETKNGQPQVVTLSPAAVRILETRKASTKSEWVFPGRGRSGHLVEPKMAWKRILKRAGLKDLRLHDLRRTLGSWQAAGGASLPIIGKSLGHSSLSATQVYARLDLGPVRQSVNRAVDAMLIAGGLQPALLEQGDK